MPANPGVLKTILPALRDPHGDQVELVEKLKALAKATRALMDFESVMAAKLAAGYTSRILYRHNDKQLVLYCLAVLLQSGKNGRLAARRQIQSQFISLQELAVITKKLPPAPRLLLGHQFLATLETLEDKSLTSWLEEVTSTLSTADSEKLLKGLAVLGREGTLLAYPVKRILMAGDFYPWFRTALSAPVGKKDVEQFAMALAALADRDLARYAYRGVAAGAIEADPRLINVLASLAPPDDAELSKALQALLKRSEFRAAPECVDGFLRMRWPRTGEMIALLLSKRPKMKESLAVRACLLTEYGLGTLLKKLAPAQKTDFLARMFTAIALLDPDFLMAQLKTESDEAAMYAAQLKAFVSENASGLVNVVEKATPVSTVPGEEESKPGFMGRILGDKRQALEKLLNKSSDVGGKDCPGSILRKADLKRNRFSHSTLSECMFESVSFYKTEFRDCDLSASQFKGCRFTECSFRDCRLDDACFEKTTFSRCEMLYCDAGDTSFSNSTLSQSTFKGMIMPRLRMIMSSSRHNTWDQCILTGAHWQSATSELCHFLGTDFSYASLLNTTVMGAEFADCMLNNTSLVDSRFPGCDFSRSSTKGCRMRGVDSSHPLFIRSRLDWLHRAVTKLDGKLPAPPETALNSEALPVIRRAVVRWVRHLGLAHREASMLMDNAKRYNRAMGILEPEQRKFIKLLPHILHTDIFDQKLGINNVPACSVSSYEPDSSILELAEEVFPGIEQGSKPPELIITGLYTMGSYGSVAQTAQSDIDCWVCVDSDTATHDALHGLKKKLDALTLWADLQFGLEAHFFAMSEETVRQNDFGYSDKESSGSAQAILLKEEFYRSALKLAGKNLAWWLVPAGADPETYLRYAKEAIAYPLSDQHRVLDLGPLDNIPPGEFFGAAMWQIVKALHSPFKSVMKLGLLERYSGFSSSGGMPLCDSIKGNIFRGVTDIQHIDSYTALFRELRKHYSGNNDKNAVDLLTESFVAKTDFNHISMFLDHPASEDGRRMIQAIFGENTAVSGRTLPRKSAWNFSKSLKMGEVVSRFMTATYQRIQQEISKGGSTASAMITPEDMTRLGRRISSNFANKPHKVSRVPFMDVGKNAFATLHLSALKKPGKKTVWVVQGSQQSEGKSSVREMQVLRKDYDPAMLLAWLYFNGLYNPDVLIQADRTIAPLAVTDIQKLMAAMTEFFPLEDTFERDIDEGLRPERVIRAFFLLNLTAPHDMKKVAQATVIYSTTWGEVFCQTFDAPDPSIEKQASAFLQKAIKRPLQAPLDMQSFIPKGSQCTRIKLV